MFLREHEEEPGEAKGRGSRPVTTAYKDDEKEPEGEPRRMAMAPPRTRLRMGSPPLSGLLFLGLLGLLAPGSWSQPLDPAMGPSEIPVEVQMPTDQVIYDQRQNGTENLRIQMSGVTFVLAPAEAIANFPQDIMETGVKPKHAASAQPKSRLTNLLLGFLNKNQH